jgi:hypothetical protein
MTPGPQPYQWFHAMAPEWIKPLPADLEVTTRGLADHDVEFRLTRTAGGRSRTEVFRVDERLAVRHTDLLLEIVARRTEECLRALGYGPPNARGANAPKVSSR